MKEIIKEHGGAMFTAAVVISVLTIIFSAVTDSDGNRGIVKIIAAHMDTEGIDYNAYIDYGAYQSEIAKDAPTIEYQGTGSLVLGTVQVADYVKAHDYNGQELAVKLSKSQSSIANKLRILKLEDSVKKLLLEHHFTERHARALLKLPDEESRLFVLAQMIQEEMNVKKTEELVEATLEQMRPRFPEKGEQKEKRYVRSSDFRLFTNTIKQSVEVIRRSGVDVVYEDKQDADCCEILIRIRKNAVESA